MSLQQINAEEVVRSVTVVERHLARRTGPSIVLQLGYYCEMSVELRPTYAVKIPRGLRRDLVVGQNHRAPLTDPCLDNLSPDPRRRSGHVPLAFKAPSRRIGRNQGLGSSAPLSRATRCFSAR